MKYSVVIPVYKNEASIARLLELGAAGVGGFETSGSDAQGDWLGRRVGGDRGTPAERQVIEQRPHMGRVYGGLQDPGRASPVLLVIALAAVIVI